MGEYPSPVLARGVPYPVLDWGTHPVPDRGYLLVPPPSWDCCTPLPEIRVFPLPGTEFYPPEMTWYQWKYYGMEMGYPPKKGMRLVEVLWDGDEVKTPPPSTKFNRHTPEKNITSSRTTYVVGSDTLNNSEGYFTCESSYNLRNTERKL